MCDKRPRNISENSPWNCRDIRFGGKFPYYFRSFIVILLLILLLPCCSVSDNLTCHRLPMVMQKFLDNHYAMKNMTGEIKTRAVDQMIKNLDPSKTMLYESDVKRLKPILQNLFSSMKTGNCTALREVYDVLVARARENETVVKEILGPGYRHDETVELSINVEKRPFVKTLAEKHELLRKLVHFQIENALLSGMDMEEAKKQQIHHYTLQTMRVVEHDPEELITNAAKAFASALDPHTSYMSPEDYEDFQIQMQLSLEGIGAALSSDNGFAVIEELVAGGSAARSGLLKPKDKIIAVAQEGEKPISVIDMDLQDVTRMIRGRKGTKVTLTILRQAESTYRFNATITRDKVELKEQEAKIEYVTRSAGARQYRFGVIDLPSFYGDEKQEKSCYEDVKKLLMEAKRQRVDGIVLDLSRNGGGLLTEAVRLTGLFIGNGGIVATRDSHGQVTILANGSAASGVQDDERKVILYPAEDPQELYTGPLVVLTSRLSASASEIVAGALKDYRRAVIVGSDHTFGKGSVQVMISLPWNLGGMTITRDLFFLPGGRSTQKTGVEANVMLPNWFILEDIGETALDYPLPAQAITPFLDKPENSTPPWKHLNRSLLAELAERSQARIAKDVKFTEIMIKNREAASRHGMIRLADLRREMTENSGKKKESIAERRQKARDQFSPFLEESVNVLTDMITLRSPELDLS